MSTISNSYADLLIMQYLGKPKAYAMVDYLASLGIIDQLPLSVQQAFTLGTAAGVQLDVLGQYVGLSRNGYTFSAPVSLDDEDYTAMILVKVALNKLGSSLYDIQAFLHEFFPDIIQIFDHRDMRINYQYDVLIGTNLFAEFFIKARLLPKPMAVNLGPLVYPGGLTNFFGFQSSDNTGYQNSGFNDSGDYQTDEPWLSSANSIII